jgi:hypothetical protein
MAALYTRAADRKRLALGAKGKPEREQPKAVGGKRTGKEVTGRKHGEQNSPALFKLLLAEIYSS